MPGSMSSTVQMFCLATVIIHSVVHLQKCTKNNKEDVLKRQYHSVTRGQSNLAKAASNAPHTLHSQDSLATAVPKICTQSQKVQVGHMTMHPTPYDVVLSISIHAFNAA